jgi:hypothetical protein
MWLAAPFVLVAAALTLSSGSAAGEISVERGRQVSIASGCHDCHTEGYRQSEGRSIQRRLSKGARSGGVGHGGRHTQPIFD